jgi:hyperosmotically inducible protein
MRMHRSSGHLLLAACAAAAAAAAQAPPSAPLSLPPRQYSTLDSPASQDVSDAQLGLEARARLYEGLGVSNLSVLVRQGVARIGGTVRSETDRERAEQLAREVPGITNVINELRIADSLTIALANEAAAAAAQQKADIENAVAERIRLDPVLGSRSIRVTADALSNTITLTGTVSTEEEKTRAGQIAVGALPAGNVRNLLEVRQRL